MSEPKYDFEDYKQYYPIKEKILNKPIIITKGIYKIGLIRWLASKVFSLPISIYTPYGWKVQVTASYCIEGYIYQEYYKIYAYTNIEELMKLFDSFSVN